MDENGADTPEQVLKFVPKERLRGYAPRVEEAGEAIIANRPLTYRMKTATVPCRALCSPRGCARGQFRVRPRIESGLRFVTFSLRR
jgi:hypothetical protein